MTVDTPFPPRPATPFWDPRGRFGMGDASTDITTALNDATAAYVASTCPTGTVLNTQTGVCQTVGAIGVGGSSSGGLLLLALLVVVVMAGGK